MKVERQSSVAESAAGTQSLVVEYPIGERQSLVAESMVNRAVGFSYFM